MVSFYTEQKSKLFSLVKLTIKRKEKLSLQEGIYCVFAVSRYVH